MIIRALIISLFAFLIPIRSAHANSPTDVVKSIAMNGRGVCAYIENQTKFYRCWSINSGEVMDEKVVTDAMLRRRFLMTHVNHSSCGLEFDPVRCFLQMYYVDSAPDMGNTSTSGIQAAAWSPDVGCVYRSFGGLDCWRRSNYTNRRYYSIRHNGDGATFYGTTWMKMDLGEFHGCLTYKRNSQRDGVYCWGGEVPEKRSYFRSGVPSYSSVTDLAVADSTNCLIDNNTSIKCWGYQYWITSKIPAVEKPRLLTAGGNTMCVLYASGINCWGSPGYTGIIELSENDLLPTASMLTGDETLGDKPVQVRSDHPIDKLLIENMETDESFAKLLEEFRIRSLESDRIIFEKLQELNQLAESVVTIEIPEGKDDAANVIAAKAAREKAIRINRRFVVLLADNYFRALNYRFFQTERKEQWADSMSRLKESIPEDEPKNLRDYPKSEFTLYSAYKVLGAMLRTALAHIPDSTDLNRILGVVEKLVEVGPNPILNKPRDQIIYLLEIEACPLTEQDYQNMEAKNIRTLSEALTENVFTTCREEILNALDYDIVRSRQAPILTIIDFLHAKIIPGVSLQEPKLEGTLN